MEEVQTWRELLGKLAGDPQERQRIAEALGINTVTVARWISGKSNPRQDNLRPLLDIFPAHRQQFVELIEKEFPYFGLHSQQNDELHSTIPSTFYAHILGAFVRTPLQLRNKTICLLVLQQMVEHLDPQRQGMIATIFQCIAPRPGHKVRSLRLTFTRGTGPFAIQGNSWIQLAGAEAQTGLAASKGHPIVVQSAEEGARLFPTHRIGQTESVAAYPILIGDRVAGVVCVNSMQVGYFTPIRREILQNYTDLLTLAFEQHEFYSLQAIELGVMPSGMQQQPLVNRFHQRLTQHLIATSRNPQLRMAAEPLAWQEIEEELLSIPRYTQKAQQHVHNHGEPEASAMTYNYNHTRKD
ncbi:MAG TPA: GAF domain-containing protein [Ktedonobacteraceae bacterium]|nr:GAF domain-containing protein [Ktedonobacteraceae bacterium]